MWFDLDKEKVKRSRKSNISAYWNNIVNKFNNKRSLYLNYVLYPIR